MAASIFRSPRREAAIAQSERNLDRYRARQEEIVGIIWMTDAQINAPDGDGDWLGDAIASIAARNRADGYPAAFEG